MWAEGRAESSAAGKISRAWPWLRDRAAGSGPSGWARVDAGSTNALGLEQEEHLQDEGQSLFGFRNVWLTMEEKCQAGGNMGGAVTLSPTHTPVTLGTEIQHHKCVDGRQSHW